jgi:uncharacterized protein (DUF1330 family)
MKIAQTPTPAQIEELMHGPQDTPVVMVNLLKFKEQADGGNEGMSGRESYMRYGEKMRELVESSGGRFLYMGTADSMVLGETDFEWDAIALVEYPSRKAFVEIATSQRVAEIGRDRARGLEGQWLIASTRTGGLGEA